MIFSKTAESKDLIKFGLWEVLMGYLQDKNSVENYSSSLYKFWEYSLLLKLIDYYNLNNPSILNVTRYGNDSTIEVIARQRNLIINQSSSIKLMKMPIKTNKYDIVCAFGVIEHVKNEFTLIEKLSKHVKANGYLIIITDGDIESKKKHIIEPEDMMNISLLLEDFGYDFCSDDDDPLSYNDKSDIHSLVMKRMGS